MSDSPPPAEPTAHSTPSPPSPASAPGSLVGRLGSVLARYLAGRRHAHGTAAPTDPQQLADCLQPADVLLVEGDTRFSAGIKYLTQSTWSHAALYVGDLLGPHGGHAHADPAVDGACAGDARRTPALPREGLPCVIEADVVDGVRAVGLDSFAGLHVRVCRPVSLRPEEARAVAAHAIARLGHRYDLKNILDLMRWLVPTPPVPLRWRRRMIAMGSGDPTRAICSGLIAEAFASVRYPILPRIEQRPRGDPMCPGCVDEILHVRHHSLFVPRDFDVSPYFQIVKPGLVGGFDHQALAWAEAEAGLTPPG